MAGKDKHRIDPDELRNLYQTKTMAQLAEHFGCGESTIWARLKRHGITHETYGELGHRQRPRVFSEEHRRNMSVARRGKYVGERAGNWQGGKTLESLKARGSPEYKAWRKAALELRGSRCQSCGVGDGAVCECCGASIKLHVHHVESFARVVERRFDPTNSEVLCPKCHYSRHSGKIG